MRTSLQSPVLRRRSTRGEIDSMVSGWQERLQAPDGVRFVPARWLLATLALLRLRLGGRKIGTLGIAGFVWSLTPPKLKLVAAGLAAAALIVLAGAFAALVLLAMQLT